MQQWCATARVIATCILIATRLFYYLVAIPVVTELL